MIEYKDMRGVVISVNDIIAYGKSSRHDPINLGKVVNITEDYIEVLGKGNVKTGKIPRFHSDRILVLPDDYLEEI